MIHFYHTVAQLVEYRFPTPEVQTQILAVWALKGRKSVRFRLSSLGLVRRECGSSPHDMSSFSNKRSNSGRQKLVSRSRKCLIVYDTIMYG